MTSPRQRRSTLIYMTVLVGFALLTALCTGFQVGRHTGPRPRARKKRTSRLALSRLTASLLVLIVARRMQRLLVQHGIPAVAGFCTALLTGARSHILRKSPTQRGLGRRRRLFG